MSACNARAFLSANAKRGRGTARSAVEGAPASERFDPHSYGRSGRIHRGGISFAGGSAHPHTECRPPSVIPVAPKAPSTAPIGAVPLHRFAGADEAFVLRAECHRRFSTMLAQGSGSRI
jgi:hypothetical protein